MEKKSHHKNNRMADRYKMNELIEVLPELKTYVSKGPKGFTIDFSNAEAVKTLNHALLSYHYKLKFWDLPPNYLVPPIPGRLDYILHLADFLAKENRNKIPRGNKIYGLDIGTGSTAIYSILANLEFSWSMKGSDIDTFALNNAKKILRENKPLSKHITLVRQANQGKIFKGVIDKDEHFDFCVCNPPYYKDEEEAQSANLRKTQNLSKSKDASVNKNFGGVVNELIYPGGEKTFLTHMIQQSRGYGNNVLWFTALVSSQKLLNHVKTKFNEVKVEHHHIIDISHGNKKSRIICWTFLKPSQRRNWIKIKWNT